MSLKDKTNCLVVIKHWGFPLSFAMAESVFSGGKKSRPLHKQIFAVLTVLCVLGGIVYITGLSKQIHEAINQMVTPQEPQLQRRRYAIHVLMFRKHFDLIWSIHQSKTLYIKALDCQKTNEPVAI